MMMKIAIINEIAPWCSWHLQTSSPPSQAGDLGIDWAEASNATRWFVTLAPNSSRVYLWFLHMGPGLAFAEGRTLASPAYPVSETCSW